MTYLIQIVFLGFVKALNYVDRNKLFQKLEKYAFLET